MTKKIYHCIRKRDGKCFRYFIDEEWKGKIGEVFLLKPGCSKRGWSCSKKYLDTHYITIKKER